ncbi:MAG: ABC transporter ATP-binding protein [Gemmatimonadales bacterium]|nr:ABC transporter ATP-binding protein [Gemmatimonadales bacterium]
MKQARVVVAGLSKRFGRMEVLRDVNLAIAPGRITAIVGPNAAGKSTLIKTLLGLVRPGPSALVAIDGVPVNGGPRYLERVGYMPQVARFPEQLTGGEILRFLQELRGDGFARDEELVELFRLGASLDRPVRTLSGGTRQKLNAVIAFLFRPTLLILDEPTAGLDPVAARILKDKVRRASSTGVAVVLTSHIMAEIEELAEDLIFLVDGAIVFQGAVSSLLEESDEPTLERAIARRLEGHVS